MGDATAEAAREAGFARVQSADGAVQDLADRIAADPPPGAVLWAGAQAPAGDLRGALAARGVTVRAVAVYQALTLAQPAALAALASGAVDAVLIHSPRAAEALAAAWAATFAESGVPARAVAISGAAAAPLRRLGFRSVAVAAHPDEASLLAALGKPGPRV